MWFWSGQHNTLYRQIPHHHEGRRVIHPLLGVVTELMDGDTVGAAANAIGAVAGSILLADRK